MERTFPTVLLADNKGVRSGILISSIGVGTATTSGYAAIAEQLDQLYRDMKAGKLGVGATTGEWYVGITSVRTIFPKS